MQHAGCGHCKNLKGPLSAAATTLKAEGIAVGNVDATVYGDIAQRFGVRGYPTLKIFKSGKDFEYAGTRTPEGLVKGVRAKAGAGYATVATADAAKAFVAARPANYGFAFVGVFPSGLNSKLAKSFLGAADSLRELRSAAVASTADAAAGFGVSGASEGVFVVRPWGTPVAVEYTGDESSSNDITAWVYASARPVVGWYDDAYAPIYTAAKKHVAKVFVPVSGSDASQVRYFANRVRKAAEKHADTLVAVVAGTGDGIARQEVSAFGFGKNPIVVVHEDGDASQVYRMETDFSPANVAAFFDAFAAGSLEKFVKSEPVPATQGPVTVVVGKTFDALVAKNDEQDVMIEFYAPWCGHCKSLEPKYTALGEKVKAELTDRQVVVGKLDATANDWAKGQFEVSGYPTIFFKPAGGKPVVYNGARETEALFKYISENAKSKPAAAGSDDGKDEL